MEYNLFLGSNQPYEVIGYNGNGSRGLCRYAVDWGAFLKRDCPYILTIRLSSAILIRENGDYILKAHGFYGNNYEGGDTTEKKASNVLGIIKVMKGSKAANPVIGQINGINSFKTYLDKRPSSPFFDIEILNIAGLPVLFNPDPFNVVYVLMMNFKEVLPSIQATIKPKIQQLTFYSDNAINAPIATLGTTAIFNIDWSFLEDKPYIVNYSFYSSQNSSIPTASTCLFINIPVQNTTGANTLTAGKIQNQNTTCLGFNPQRSYQGDGTGLFYSDLGDNFNSTMLGRPKGNLLEIFLTANDYRTRSGSPARFRITLYFTEL